MERKMKHIIVLAILFVFENKVGQFIFTDMFCCTLFSFDELIYCTLLVKAL